MSTTMEKPKKTKAAAVATPEIKAALVVSVPFLASAKYAQREIHMRLDQPQAITLRSVFEALEESHAKLANGHPVQSPQDAMRYILEVIANGATLTP